MASPYQIAGTRASLADLLQQSNLQQQQSQRAGSKQMGEMQEKFEDELEKLQSDARKRSKKNKGLGSLLNIAALGLGPLGAGIAKGLSSGLQLQDQKTGAKMLLNKDMQKRYGNTFLRGGMKNFTEMAKDAQVSSGDVLRGAFGGGLSGFAMSKMLGGSKEDGGLFKQMGEAKDAQKLMPQVEKGYEEYLQDAFKGSEEQYSEYLSELGDVSVPGQKTLEDFKSGVMNKQQFAETSVNDIFKKFKVGGSDSTMSNVLSSKNPALQQLLESFKDFSGGKLKGGMEEMQSAIMLPMLLQQLLGE
tara:strand:+ start:3305 stop:4210 length:906 start_codon:yes stop_codon:yes gene_type:complete